jgi:hypothetical protein
MAREPTKMEVMEAWSNCDDELDEELWAVARAADRAATKMVEAFMVKDGGWSRYEWLEVVLCCVDEWMR